MRVQCLVITAAAFGRWAIATCANDGSKGTIHGFSLRNAGRHGMVFVADYDLEPYAKKRRLGEGMVAIIH